MDQVIVVRLAPGEVAFFDPLTNVHLTIGNPSATIGAGKNLSGIKRSVKSRRLILVSGSLEPATVPVAKPVEPVVEAKAIVPEIKEEPVIVEAASEEDSETVPEEVAVVEEAGEKEDAVEETDEVADSAEEVAAEPRRKKRSGK